MNELINRTELSDKLNMLDGCFIDHPSSHQEVYRDWDRESFGAHIVPPPLMGNKSIYLILYDVQAFYESDGHQLLKDLEEMGFDVQHDVSCNVRYAQDMETLRLYEYRHRVEINLCRPIDR